MKTVSTRDIHGLTSALLRKSEQEEKSPAIKHAKDALDKTLFEISERYRKQRLAADRKAFADRQNEKDEAMQKAQSARVSSCVSATKPAA
jgi:hypothetical protein